jgi:hypothetical protein
MTKRSLTLVSQLIAIAFIIITASATHTADVHAAMMPKNSKHGIVYLKGMPESTDYTRRTFLRERKRLASNGRPWINIVMIGVTRSRTEG